MSKHVYFSLSQLRRNLKLRQEYIAIVLKEHWERNRAIRNNEDYKVSSSRLNNLNLMPSSKQSPIQQAVQDSFTTMEELREKRRQNHDNTENNWQETYQSNEAMIEHAQNQPIDGYYQDDNSPNDDFAKQIAAAELDNAKWSKNKIVINPWKFLLDFFNKLQHAINLK